MSYKCLECGNIFDVRHIELLSAANGVSCCPYCGEHAVRPIVSDWSWLTGNWRIDPYWVFVIAAVILALCGVALVLFWIFHVGHF